MDDLQRLYDQHGPALFSFVLNLTRREADACDLVQEIFRKLAERPDLLRGVIHERSFLLRMAHNLTVDLIRRRSTRERTCEAIAGESIRLFLPAADPDHELFRAQLTEALAQLPPDQRAVVHLKLWEELTFDEIARALEIPANTAASRYRYGIDKLRGLLRPLFNEIQ
jgi:RNA polymerase sigma-70 factor, ECF subfamily